MQSSTVALVCWILCLRLTLAKSSVKLDDHDLVRRIHPANGRSHSGSVIRRSLVERDYSPVRDYASAAVQTSYDAGATGSDSSYVAGSLSSTESLSFSSAKAATTSVASEAVASTQPALVPLPATPTCDKTHTKSEINKLLIQCEAKLKVSTDPIQTFVQQVTKDNAAQVGAQMATNLKEILTQLKLYLSNVQLCGTDAKPLSTDKGIALSDVSWSAFQVVLTLKDVFQCISGLYKPFPVIKTLCSDPLLTISTALASLIGACGEQINLFDTRFFPLVTPQLEEFTSLDDNFVSFVGSFTS